MNYLPDSLSLTVVSKYLNALTSFDNTRLTYLLFSMKKKTDLSSLHFIYNNNLCQSHTGKYGVKHFIIRIRAIGIFKRYDYQLVITRTVKNSGNLREQVK